MAAGGRSVVRCSTDGAEARFSLGQKQSSLPPSLRLTIISDEPAQLARLSLSLKVCLTVRARAHALCGSRGNSAAADNTYVSCTAAAVSPR